MRAAFGVSLAVLMFGLAGCNKAPKLDGTYVLVGLEAGGDKMDELITQGPEADRTVTIAGDKMISKKDGKDDTVTFKLDTSKSPPHIDLFEAGEKDDTAYGIYKLEGDTLTICFAESNKPEDRPKEFKTTKDNNAIIMTLKKKK